MFAFPDTAVFVGVKATFTPDKRRSISDWHYINLAPCVVQKTVICYHPPVDLPHSPSPRSFRTFCNQTSLHGWQYMAQKQTSKAKCVFWVVIVVCSMAIATLFLYNNTMDFMQATVREEEIEEGVAVRETKFWPGLKLQGRLPYVGARSQKVNK